MSFSSLLFLGTIVLGFFVFMGETSTPEYIKYTTVTGYFQQDDLATNASIFNYVRTLPFYSNLLLNPYRRPLPTSA